METQAGEDLKYRRIRAGLHRETHGETVCIRKGQHRLRLGLEGGLIVDVTGGAMRRRNLLSRCRREEGVGFHGSDGRTLARPPRPSSLFAIL